MKEQIDKILFEGKVTTWFQPIINLQKNIIIGYEALARGPAGRYHLPYKLFEKAKKRGLLVELERACLKSALDSASHLDPELKIFVNFNPSQVEEVLKTIRSMNGNSIKPDRIVFEMTEHSRINNYDKLLENCRFLKNNGYLLAIDDVGSGYDRLRSIAEFDPEYIKIDRPLVSGSVVNNGSFKVVVKNVVALANEVGCAIIAEGIETHEELKLMRSLGITLGQGYLFSRPVPVDLLHNKNQQINTSSGGCYYGR
ncbi:MAG: putative membrane protein YjcC [Pelotomaculum sp. PtaB.Bin104]|nr:MAG: putative membrane protein YjcC [Pelotomaculum sp. PtaB.Bin104]